jgi:hypothetical protein
MLRSGPPFALKDRLLKSGPELQNAHHAVGTRRVSATRLRLPQGELSRKTNQVARARIRRFESDMPSQTVWSLTVVIRAGDPSLS